MSVLRGEDERGDGVDENGHRQRHERHDARPTGGDSVDLVLGAPRDPAVQETLARALAAGKQLEVHAQERENQIQRDNDDIPHERRSEVRMDEHLTDVLKAAQVHDDHAPGRQDTGERRKRGYLAERLQPFHVEQVDG